MVFGLEDHKYLLLDLEKQRQNILLDREKGAKDERQGPLVYAYATTATTKRRYYSLFNKKI